METSTSGESVHARTIRMARSSMVGAALKFRRNRHIESFVTFVLAQDFRRA